MSWAEQQAAIHELAILQREIRKALNTVQVGEKVDPSFFTVMEMVDNTLAHYNSK